MKYSLSFLCFIRVLLISFWVIGFQAQAQNVIMTEKAKALDLCLACHVNYKSVKEIFYTPHGTEAHPQSPMNQQQCQSCHGNTDQHLTNPGQIPPEIAFTQKSTTTADIQNQTCLNCHHRDSQAHLSRNVHQQNDVKCVDCHRVHKKQDPILNGKNQIAICTDCHTRVRHEVLKLSSHPFSKADMSCTSCHAAHGSLVENQLKLTTLNQTCYECHADFRGPFLWEHAPVREQCTSCHVPHGSNHRNMLKTRVPMLCQQCHSMVNHPSQELTADGLQSGNSNNRFLLVKGCLNCHSAIHGSNHPSGVKLIR